MSSVKSITLMLGDKCRCSDNTKMTWTELEAYKKSKINRVRLNCILCGMLHVTRVFPDKPVYVLMYSEQ